MRRRTVKILTGVAIALTTLPVIYAIALGISAVKLRRAYAALQRDGRPITLAQVVPPELPDRENAVLLYQSAALLLRAQPAPEKDLLEYLDNLTKAARKDPLDPNRQAELDTLLGQDVVDQALSIVEQGTQRPACRVDSDYTEGLALSLSHLPQMRSLTWIAGAKALLQAREGRIDDAWHTAIVQLKLADALRTEPLIVSQLVRAAQIDTACTTIQKLCEFAAPNEQSSRILQDLLGRYDDRTPLIRAVDGERVIFGEQTFGLPKDELRKVLSDIHGEGRIPEIIARLMVLGISFKPLSWTDHAAYLRAMQDYTERFAQPYDPNDIHTMSRDFSQVQKCHILTSILLPNMGRVKEVFLRRIAQIRVTRTGLALLQYRDMHGSLPDTLGALSAESIRDPFSQGSLRYNRQDTGFDLYSVGPDQSDNGGAPKKPGPEADYDIVWHFSGPD
jgi:hypothetical protein